MGDNKHEHPALVGPTQEERAANPTYIILEFSKPLNDGDVEVIGDALYDRPPITPGIKRMYTAYDNGFGRLVPTEPQPD